MATTPQTVPAAPDAPQDLQALAKRHLWMHFTRMGAYESADVPVIARGEGCYVWDTQGNRYLDGALRAVLRERRARARRDRRGHGRAGGRARLLHQLELRAPARDRAGGSDRVYAPGDLNRVFFTSVAPRPSSPRSSWRATTTASAATGSGTR